MLKSRVTNELSLPQKEITCLNQEDKSFVIKYFFVKTYHVMWITKKLYHRNVLHQSYFQSTVLSLSLIPFIVSCLTMFRIFQLKPKCFPGILYKSISSLEKTLFPTRNTKKSNGLDFTTLKKKRKKLCVFNFIKNCYYTTSFLFFHS